MSTRFDSLPLIFSLNKLPADKKFQGDNPGDIQRKIQCAFKVPQKFHEQRDKLPKLPLDR